MIFANDSTGASPGSIEEYEALQHQRLLAYRANVAALQSAELSYSLQTQFHPPMNQPPMNPFAVPSLSSNLLNPFTSSIDAQRLLLGSSTLLDLPRLQAYSRPSLCLQPPLPVTSPMVRSGLHAMQSFPAGYPGPLLQSHERLPSSIPAKIQIDAGTLNRAPTASAAPALLKQGLVESHDGAHTTLPRAVFTDCDEQHLSKYQCLLRKQIEFYES